VDVDATEGRLTEFTCREPTTSTYKYRFLKAATAVAGNFLGGGGGSGGGGANAGDDGVTMTRASISARGFLKIVHLLHLSRNDVSFAASELNAFMVPVTFVVHPEDDLDDDDEHDDENERET
jgi:cell cycle checkpoint protein